MKKARSWGKVQHAHEDAGRSRRAAAGVRYAERRVNRRPKLTIVAPDASPEEAAAVVAALERFMRETAPTPAPPPPSGPSPWQRAALHEGVAREPADPLPWQ
jgi:hypothetical protein